MRVIAVASGLWRRAATVVHTAAFVGEMLPGPLKAQRWCAPEPHRTTTRFLRHDGTPDQAEVYAIPGDRPRAAVLVFIGATPQGVDDPDAVKLGWALARTGFAVMFYWSETMGLETRLRASDVPNVVAAFEHLARQPYADPERLGLAGFSVGASYAMVASADPRISDNIAFMNFFGAYFDGADLLVQIAAGRSLCGVSEARWEVDDLTKSVFTNTLSAIPASEGGDALLAGVDSIQNARQLYASLPEDFRADVCAVSPSRYVADLSNGAVLRIMHDRGDTIIPVGESRRLVAALRRERPDIEVHFTETDIFRHVSPDADTKWIPLVRGAWQVCRHMYHIISVTRQYP